MLGSLLIFLGVAAGAFGSHGLAPYFVRYPELEKTYDTAVRYHLFHGLALLAVAGVSGRVEANLANWSGYLLFAGVIIFSGTLYLLVFTRLRWLGAVTPLGGMAFLLGWLCLFLAAYRK